MEKKTDESVKTGLHIEGNSNPDKLTIAGAETGTSNDDALEETDANELVHGQSSDTSPAANVNDDEQHIDDIVHSIPASKNSTTDNTEVDPDDMAH